MDRRFSACQRKVRHATRAAAEAELARLEAQGQARGGMNVHHCPLCQGFHLGKLVGTRRHRGRRWVG